MTEEKETPKEEKPKEEKAPAEAKPQAGPVAQEKKEAGQKKKKINRLTLKELEKKIEEVRQKMGGLNSFYAQQLLKRKKQLIEAQETREENKEETTEGKEENAA